MAEAWGGKGAVTVMEAVPGANHFTVLTGMDDPAHPATSAILRQMARG